MSRLPWKRSSSVRRYLVAPKTFCLASKESATPRARAVRGMSCMIPCAPRLETADESKRDSRNAIAAARFGSTANLTAASPSQTERAYCTDLEHEAKV